MRRELEKVVRAGAAGLMILATCLLSVPEAKAQVASGYAEYYVPASENTMSLALRSLGPTPSNNTHAVIAITAWADNTTVYYDHWEDGIDFNPNNTTTADEVFTLDTGDVLTLDNTPAGGIPIPRSAAATYYDGGDRIYVAGGTVTVTRAGWLQGRGQPVQAVAWEVYPVKPQLTTYIVPFGENLSIAPKNYTDFLRTYVLIQATAPNTTFQVDLDGNGTWDTLDLDYDGDTTGGPDTNTVNLAAGETFFLGNVPTNPNPAPLGARATVNSKTVIQGSATLQIKFIIGDPSANYETRGLSAFPRGYWSREYYAPVWEPTSGTKTTDIFLYNPNSSDITVNWQTISGAGSFSLAAGDTLSYRSAAGSLPTTGGVYLSGSNSFWGVSTVDSTGQVNEWAYSLLPSSLLYSEHFLGWAPGGTDGNDSGVFLTVVQDNTRVFVDVNNDGVADQTYTLNRLQTQYITDATDGDLGGAHFWATGPFTMSYGQNPDTAPDQAQSGDLGYVAIPGTDFVSLVMTVEKSADPAVVPTASGARTTFTIKVNSLDYPVDDVTVVDRLPANWQYVANSTLITRADQSTSTADPTVTGTGPYTLTWPSTVLFGMQPNQEIEIRFEAETTSNLLAGTISENRVTATGTRTPPVGSTQIFTAKDSAFVVSGDIAIAKSSTAQGPLYPGDTLGYTVRVTSPFQAATQTNVSLYDPIPVGLAYVGGSGSISCELGTAPRNVRDNFATNGSYAGNNGTVNWTGAWTESDALGGGATSGLALVTGNALRMGLARNVRDEFGANAYTNNNGSVTWGGPWTETDRYGNGATGPTGGHARVNNGALQFRYLLATVIDDFDDNGSYSGSNGTNPWTGPWTESNDTGGAGGGAVLVANNRLQFTNGTADRSASRSASVAGAASVTVTFALNDSGGNGGIESGETLVAEYSLDGSPFILIGTFSGNGDTYTGSASCPGTTRTCTIALSGNNTLTIRFRAPEAWDGSNGDVAYADAVSLSFVPVIDTQVTRPVNLDGAVTANLSLSFTPSGLESGDTFVIEATSNGTDFSVLETLNGPAAAGNRSYDLVSLGLASANFAIRFRVTGGLESTNESLTIDNVDITFTSPPITSVQRSVDLSAASGPALSFSTASANLELSDTAVIEASDNGADFTTLATFAGGTAVPAGPYSLAQFVSASTTIRFRITGGFEELDETISFDNVDITWGHMTTFAAGSPPVFLASSAGCSIRGGGRLILTFDTTVNNPFPSGQTTVTNTAATTSTQYPVQITASKTDLVTNPSALSSSAAGRIWFDTDRDGIDDVGEPGIANVDVTLKDEFGTPIATVTTDSNGRYLFPNVLPKPCTGSCPRDPATTAPYYYVEVSSGLPGGLSQTCCSGRILDNQTRRFYLAAGENRTGLDMGYTTPADTVAFGDTVWIDTNGNGAQNPGEIGLGGATVQLYRDANSDGLLQPGSDTLVATATTAPDGSYLFAGITPTGATYFVAAATPAGYIATTPLNQRFTSVTGNTSYLTADFGFEPTSSNPLYSISDRVWLDENGNQAYGGGEIGIGGVTIDLLDASLNVIGTTTTAADGTFTFAGLTGGGADYTVRITDVNGVLADFSGTTTYAQNRQRGEPNLTANIDRRNATPCDPAIAPCPSYGFRPTRAIGDTLFFDAANYGVEDPGEGGIPGVLVSLYSDGNGDGIINGADAVIRTLTTDAAGHYLFSGLTNGNYIVSVPLQPGYTYSDNSFLDSDTTAAGIQRAVPMTGTTVLTADFGFHPNTPRSVSGTVWNDANRSGAGSPEPGESGLAGVAVSLYSDADGDGIIETGDVVVATTTTDSSGNYSFTGVASGTYVVRITDGAGILTSYESTYEVTGGRSGPFNFQEAVNLSGGNASGVNFGYAVPTPTYASVVAFDATLSAGSVVVEWKTASEVGTIGFHVERLDPKTSSWIRVNDSLLPAILTGPQGGSYRLRDATAPTRETLTYRLVETEASGLTLTYGPFRVTPERTSTFTGTFERAARPISLETASRLTASAAERAVFDIGGEAQTGVKAKILTVQTGLHRVEAADIAQRLGVPLATVTSAIASGGLLLENQGNVVSYLPEAGNTALYFYAEAIESPFTAQNATLASLAPGSLMQAGDTPLTLGRTPATSFADKVVLEEDRYPLILISSDPAGDLWAWDYLYASDPSLASRVLNVPVPSPASDMTPILTVRLRGSSDTPPAVDHDVSFSWNGSTLGSVGWGGFEPFTATFELPAQSLKAGDNALSLSSRLVPGAPYDLVYIDSIELSYRRAYRAVGNELSFTVAPGADVTVQGFTTNAIVLLDITDPRRPVPVWGARLVPASDGTFGLRFGNRGASERRFLATTLAKAGKPFQVAAVKASSLRSETNAADLIVIAPDFLARAASELVSYRQRQGRSTLLVSLESIYDEFSHSLSTPYAIRDFLKFASENWRRAPRYVTLVGRGTFDYKGISGTNDNILPTLLTPTPMGLNASDFSFLDWGTSASRNMSIGRLPVLTSQELKDYLRKITANESASGAPALAVLLTADNPDASGDFLAGSESVGAYVPLSSPASRVYLSYVDASSGREAIKSALSRGAGIFNYVGHGGLDTLAHENLFSSADVAALTKVPRLSNFVAITCSAGNFAIPGYPSLAETLVLAKDSGSQATWTASGLSNNDAGVRLNQRFFERRFVLGERVLGDLVRQSLQDIEVKSEVGYVKKIYNILGEPVSQLP
ncbi:MAG: hypothetical protein IT186_00590 [Acidobacteria bacterium]|nr:hypothetical protein [Acidobacteriota bacterium]